MGIFLDLKDENFVAVDCDCFNYLYKAENFKKKKKQEIDIPHLVYAYGLKS